MKTFLKIALFLAAVAALIVYWETNHPLSYSKYRSWIAACEAAQAKDHAAGSAVADPRKCDVSFDDWVKLQLPNATQRDPSTSEKRGEK